MTDTEYQNELSAIVNSFEQAKKDHTKKVHDLRTRYVQENKKFQISDYLYCITGIIKVSKIDYVPLYDGSLNIVYTGLPYKHWKGVLSRTKSKQKITFSEDKVKKINKTQNNNT